MFLLTDPDHLRFSLWRFAFSGAVGETRPVNARAGVGVAFSVRHHLQAMDFA